MKNVFYLIVLLTLLTSCGNKLYSYRKTVKVKSVVTKNVKTPTGPKVYMTVQEVKPASKPTSSLNITPNTVYLATKPVPSDEENVSLVNNTRIQYSSTVR